MWRKRQVAGFSQQSHFSSMPPQLTNLSPFFIGSIPNADLSDPVAVAVHEREAGAICRLCTFDLASCDPQNAGGFNAWHVFECRIVHRNFECEFHTCSSINLRSENAVAAIRVVQTN